MSYAHFRAAYVEALLWSSTDDEGEPLDTRELSAEAEDQVNRDCRAFWTAHHHLFTMVNLNRAATNAGSATEQAGHDFWLTRVGHGSGFWDGDWREPVASALTDAARSFGDPCPFVGDDGLVYFMGP